MNKRNESAPQPQLLVREFSFGRPRRSWLPSAVLASHPIDVVRHSLAGGNDAPGWNSTSSWIRRQRLN